MKWSLILAVIGWVGVLIGFFTSSVFFTPWAWFPVLSIPAVVFGYLGIREDRREARLLDEKPRTGLAIFCLVISWGLLVAGAIVHAKIYELNVVKAQAVNLLKDGRSLSLAIKLYADSHGYLPASLEDLAGVKLPSGEQFIDSVELSRLLKNFQSKGDWIFCAAGLKVGEISPYEVVLAFSQPVATPFTPGESELDRVWRLEGDGDRFILACLDGSSEARTRTRLRSTLQKEYGVSHPQVLKHLKEILGRHVLHR